ncbi:MAG TPA: hypothetical protein VK627_05205 [Edaphobacter sp.]|nr:hypothetical protein [Edaphobacter sp.]
MTESDREFTGTREDAQSGRASQQSSPIFGRPSSIADSVRLVELEQENSRLHRLIAELLLKNQQLRKPIQS